jgi:serine/threonine-protein kinase
MAPEQVTHGNVSRATDVFAASVVLWELLTSQRLFEGANQAESLFRVMSQPIPAPSSLAPSLPREFDRIVARGLSREPENRFATAREMALALEDCAPQIRPSEIASWVERIAADSLARRSLLLSAIEHTPPEALDVEGRTEHVDVRALAASDLKSPLSGLAAPMLTPGTGMAQRGRASVEHEELLTGTRAKQRSHGSPLLKFTVVGLFLTILLVGLALFIIPHEGMRPAATPLGTDARVVAPAAAPREPQTVLPEATRPVAADEPSEALEAKDALGAKGAPEQDAPEQAEPKARPPEPDEEAERKADRPSRRPSRGAQKHKNASCDPPYSIDAQGRRIFKVECM